MTNPLPTVALLAMLAGVLPAAAANAQPAPLYPYAVQQGQPYAVQVTPNTYVIQRPAQARPYPYVHERRGIISTEQAPPRFDRPHKPVDRALVEELRSRSQSKKIINTTKIVRDPPVVIEHKRYVDDPPRVIERQHVVEDAPAEARHAPASQASSRVPRRDEKRVIQADAEITILGPDRMSIRLFRKRHGAKAEAPPGE